MLASYSATLRIRQRISCPPLLVIRLAAVPPSPAPLSCFLQFRFASAKNHAKGLPQAVAVLPIPLTLHGLSPAVPGALAASRAPAPSIDCFLSSQQSRGTSNTRSRLLSPFFLPSTALSFRWHSISARFDF